MRNKMKGLFCSSIGFLVISSSLVFASDIDYKLDAVKEVYGLESCTKPTKGRNFALGNFFFESNLLAGDNDIKCRDCHLDEKGLGDGLPIAVGVGGEGHSDYRLANGTGALVQRNAMPLFDRTEQGYQTFFWDGKVDQRNGEIFSPFGHNIASGFNSPLAVAATLPLTERDEFLGQLSMKASNDLQQAVGNKLYQKRFDALSSALAARLKTSTEFLEILERSGYQENEIDLVLIGNSIADFIEHEFSCHETKWRQYLAGNNGALSLEEKEGAVLFFGKARCASCHQPPLFTDFQFHGIGVPQGDFGPNPRVRDIGRANVTNKTEDLYKFKTPPLIKVSETGPYGHNGRFDDLESVVLHHVNPIEYFVNNEQALGSKDRFRLAKYIDSRSDRLKFIEIADEKEMSAIIAFLKTL